MTQPVGKLASQSIGSHLCSQSKKQSNNLSVSASLSEHESETVSEIVRERVSESAVQRENERGDRFSLIIKYRKLYIQLTYST